MRDFHRLHGVDVRVARIFKSCGPRMAEHDGRVDAVPELFARFAATVHVPHCRYVETLPGVPTIRMFEAFACGIPLVSAPWDDWEGLFRPGLDYRVATTGAEVEAALADILANPTSCSPLCPSLSPPAYRFTRRSIHEHRPPS